MAGKRQALVMQQLYEDARQQVRQEKEEQLKQLSMTTVGSTTRTDFSAEGFKPQPLDMLVKEDQAPSQPTTTFWTQNQRTAVGMTQPKGEACTFHKTNAFTKPLGQRQDKDQPWGVPL
eukprot:m.217512 g.217512  ORF g.217512 m.217512 type:complete len:118 (-) comp52267_c0_seq1:157-510(-)